MATSINYAFLNEKKDGTIPVKIRMIHNRTPRYFPTNIFVTKSQLDKKGNVKDDRIAQAIDSLVRQYRTIVAEIPDAQYLTADEMVARVNAELDKEKGFRLDFFDYMAKKSALKEKKTKEGYISSIHSLQRYIGRETLDVNEITYSLLVGYRDWLEAENGKGCRAASRYLSCIRHIHKLAREEYNDEDVGLIRIPRQPFKTGLIPPEPVTEHRVLTIGHLMEIFAYKPVSERTKIAKDVFMLSFYLVGINTIDMYYAEKKDLSCGVLTYNRRKTDSVSKDKALMKIRIEREALAIFERHKGSNFLFDFADRYSSNENFNQNVNKGLKKIGEAIGIPKLNTYYARHTWATIARNVCGVDKYTVHESLVHSSRGSERVTDIYLERDFKRIWEANRKVIDVLHVKQQRV